jgi:hypothetical protein
MLICHVIQHFADVIQQMQSINYKLDPFGGLVAIIHRQQHTSPLCGGAQAPMNRSAIVASPLCRFFLQRRPEKPTRRGHGGRSVCVHLRIAVFPGRGQYAVVIKCGRARQRAQPCVQRDIARHIGGHCCFSWAMPVSSALGVQVQYWRPRNHAH